MSFLSQNKLLVIAAILCVVIVFIVYEILYIKYNGQPVAVPAIPRDTQKIGSGSPLTYVIVGDSTTVAQGAEYSEGIAVGSAEYLAKDFQVEYTNFGVSGAVVAEVVSDQLKKATALKPDIVLLSVGANDVTHLTRLDVVESSLHIIVSQFREANPKVKIVVTGSPQMGTAPRLPQPLRYISMIRTGQINKVFHRVVRKENLTFAPIAEKTGPAFAKKPKELFAPDNFHPSAKGYELWIPVINNALNRSLETEE